MDTILLHKGQLSKIWLAAHFERKLTKVQLIQTDIATSADAIKVIETPMALRLSGQLLLGIVRIYSKKAKYLLEDCNEALVRIKMSFKPGLVNLPEDHSMANFNAITATESKLDMGIFFNEPLVDIRELLKTSMTPTSSQRISKVEDITLDDVDVNYSLEFPRGDDPLEIEMGRDAMSLDNPWMPLNSMADMPMHEKVNDAHDILASEHGTQLSVDDIEEPKMLQSDPFEQEDPAMHLSFEIHEPIDSTVHMKQVKTRKRKLAHDVNIELLEKEIQMNQTMEFIQKQVKYLPHTIKMARLQHWIGKSYMTNMHENIPTFMHAFMVSTRQNSQDENQILEPLESLDAFPMSDMMPSIEMNVMSTPKRVNGGSLNSTPRIKVRKAIVFPSPLHTNSHQELMSELHEAVKDSKSQDSATIAMSLIKENLRNESDCNFYDMSQKMCKRDAVKFFFEILALKTNGQIDVEQSKNFGQIRVFPFGE